LSSGVLAVRTWTQRVAGFSRRSVCWSPERRIFVAVGYGGVTTSSEGIVWTPIGVDGGTDLLSVCWSPQLTLFVAVSGNLRKAMTSPDGTTWTTRISSSETIVWRSICWSPELEIFVAVAESGTNRVMTSKDGTTWNRTLSASENSEWKSVCWAPELKLFVAVAQSGTKRVMTSSNGINWNPETAANNDQWRSVCWSKELGLFLAVAESSNKVMTSSNGINWSLITAITADGWYSVCWSGELGLFVAVSLFGTYKVMTSPNGINWTAITSANSNNNWTNICWSKELGIFAVVAEGGTNRVLTSSLKGRPPTSYNLFDSSFNRIDETCKWDFSNIAVTTLNVTGTFTNTSDDRLKHNEVIITNGLVVIERLTPKFYQKTQVMLDASYNGDLSGQAWTYEAGLIAQEVLQVPDLSFVVGGGDYYQESYILKNQGNDISSNYYDISSNYYDISSNYYDISRNYYDISRNYYDISYNLIAQPYSLNYNSIIVYGLAAIKELHAKVKAQDLSLLTQQTIINSLRARMQALETNPNNN
jgi:hypothetical protein